MAVRPIVVRALAGAVAVTAVAAGVAMVSVPGQADTSPSPAGPGNPETVSATPLPTVQINGVAWSQAIIGNTVYVGGEFTQARPAGARPGTSETPRKNLLAYDIRTGKLITSWVANTNGDVRVVRAAPDGSRLYVGGGFTQVNGQSARRIAALDPATGAVDPGFSPRPDATVRAIAVTAQTVYFGGSFSSVGGQWRSRLAAVAAADGALLDWRPRGAGGDVWAMDVSPDGKQVLAGGSFTSMNGSSNPGKGMASLDAVTGANRPWKANAAVNAGGSGSAITDIVSDGSSVFATAYTLATGGGTLEGTVRMSWDGGRVEWLEDCHGDSYGVSVQRDAVYMVGHHFYCGNIPGGFHGGEERQWRRAMAFSRATTQTLRAEYGDYGSWKGTPAPSVLQWFPRLDAGSYTGMNQAAWTIEGNSEYVVAGGEFPRVQGVAQQGLVRFAKAGVAGNPNSTGPQLAGGAAAPTVTSPGRGEVVVSWRSNWDPDNTNLTYRVIRNGATGGPVATRTVRSTEWNRPSVSVRDTGLAPGSRVSYRIRATDPDGNDSWSDSVSVTVAGSGSGTDGYARSVLASGPQHFWRLGESSGSRAADLTGLDDATARNGVTRGVTGAISGDAAAEFRGSSQQTVASGTARTSSFGSSVEAWVRTTSGSGGKIVGLGNSRSGSSSSSRVGPHLYMDDAGRVHFGVWQGSNRVVSSGAGLNDGTWHHLAGTVGDAGMVLYVDGRQVASRADTTAGREYSGYWRIGGDTLSGWPNRPSRDYFTGTIDEVAVYTHQISADQVASHVRAGGGSVPAVVPGVPGSVSAVAGDGLVRVSWVAPESDGGKPVTGYVVRAFVAGGSSAVREVSVGGSVRSAVVSGLVNGSSHVVRVAAVNAVGRGEWSASSGSVTPVAAVLPARLSGGSRYETAVAVSREFFGPGVGQVVVASGENYPDALAVGPVAARRGAPVLLTPRSAVPSGVMAELRRLDPASIVLVGGTGAVSAGVERQLAGVAPVRRVWGASRYDTANAVAQLGGKAQVAYLATGENFPDALAATPSAVARNAPLLLSPRSGVPGSVLATLRSLGVSRVVLVGGTGALSPAVEATLVKAGLQVSRVAGASRYDTARLLSAGTFDSAPWAFLATGENFPDALAAGAVAGARGVPMLLTSTRCLSGVTASEIRRLGAPSLVGLGGTGALSTRALTGTTC